MLREVLFKCEKFLSQISIRPPQTASAVTPQGRVESTGGVGKYRGLHVSRKQARVLSFSRHFGMQGRSGANEGACVANSKKSANDEFIKSVGYGRTSRLKGPFQD